jgi:hypothetical protein
MKSIKCFSLIFIGFTIIVLSCKKDEVVKSNKEILTSRLWMWSSTKFDDTNIPLPDCIIDNILTFATNGTYTEDAGEVKCDPNETNSFGTWELSEDEETFTFDGSAFIIDITESKMVLTMVHGIDTIVLSFISI